MFEVGSEVVSRIDHKIKGRVVETADNTVYFEGKNGVEYEYDAKDLMSLEAYKDEFLPKPKQDPSLMDFLPEIMSLVNDAKFDLDTYNEIAEAMGEPLINAVSAIHTKINLLFIKKYDENSFKNLNNNQKVAFIAMVFETSVVDLITILADKGPEVFKLYLYANLSKSTLANAAIRITKFAEKMNEELTNKDNNPKP